MKDCLFCGIAEGSIPSLNALAQMRQDSPTMKGKVYRGLSFEGSLPSRV